MLYKLVNRCKRLYKKMNPIEYVDIINILNVSNVPELTNVSHVSNKLKQNENICQEIISNFKYEKNEQYMLNFFLKLNKVIQLYPPKKNENKFIYGQISERLFKDLLWNSCELESSILGDNCYFNDFQLKYKDNEYLFSYKTTKTKGCIRLINYHSSSKIHDLSEKIICIVNIELKSIYLLPLIIIPETLYMHKKDGLDLSSKYIKYMKKNYPCYIYTYTNDIPEHKYEEISLCDKIYKELLND